MTPIKLHETALADLTYAATPADDGKHLVARFSAETHDISFNVPSAKVIAGRGLQAWWSRRQLRRPLSYVRVDVAPTSDEPPTSLQFNCVQPGRHMIDPTIRGYDADPVSARQGPWKLIDSRQILLDRTQAVIDAAENPGATILSFEQPGQNLPRSSFIGNERTRFTELLKPMMEEFPAPDTPDDRVPEEITAVNDLAPRDTHDIIFRSSAYGVWLEVKPRQGHESGLDPVTIVYTAFEKPGENPLYSLQRPDKRHLDMPRDDREKLLSILTEGFKSEHFSKIFTTEELLRPDEDLLAACARLIPAGKDFAKYPFQNNETGEKNVLHIHVNQTGAYTVGVEMRDGLTIVSFDHTGLNIRGGHAHDEKTILKIYRIIRKLGAPPEAE